MTNPLVSIIVPVYNAQKGLSRCLESICSQTYQELEIIVLNDGSTAGRSLRKISLPLRPMCTGPRI